MVTGEDPRRAVTACRSLAINDTAASVVARRAVSVAELLNTTPASGWHHRDNLPLFVLN